MVDRPDPLTSPPPAFTEAAARRILRDGFGLQAELTPLAGERDQNFRADTPAGERFLVKISNPADSADILGMQTAALAHIERADPALPVMRTRPATTGDPWIEVKGTGGRDCAVRVFTFLPGRRTGSAALTAPALRGYGQVAARLGRALRGFFHPAADYEILWDLTHALKLRPLLAHLPAARQAPISRILDRFEARVVPALPGLRAQVIHADMSLDNVLLDDDLRVSGIVDFGDMTHAPLVFDLAVAIADVLQDRGDALDAAEVMIAGYTSVTPLEDEEAEILGDLVATRLAMAVTVIAWRRGLYPEHTGYSGTGERVFLDAIEAVGADDLTRRFRDACRGLPYRRAGSRDLLARRRSLLPRSPLFYAEPLHLVRGEGVWLFDPDGRRYLDCYNNVPVAGHSHPRVASAISAQQRLLATHSRYLHEAAVDIAARFRSTLPAHLNAVLLVNSGSEANDLAWRIARAATGRSGAVVTDAAYHGVTEATHALSPEEWAEGERHDHVATVPAPDGYRGRYRRDSAGWAERYAAHVDEAAAALGGRGLAAMYLDPACTSAGVLTPPPGYLREAAARVHALGGLVVADEVQAGYGRTGAHLWSFRPSGIEPDLVVTGKPMGNGFPVAAVVTRSELLAAIPERTEVFSTFGGNPVACVAALATLDVIEAEGLVANAAEMGGYLRQGLAKLAGAHPVIGDVRGAGLLLGVELVEDPGAPHPPPLPPSPAPGRARAVAEAMRAHGVLLGVTGPAGNVLKIRPPLVFGREHADLLLATLDDVLGRESAAGLTGN
jgi:4-aminobutyrate aminotransferase-like enzyme/Ser/Thr protein kinase RdoA (MazF antagonist)